MICSLWRGTDFSLGGLNFGTHVSCTRLVVSQKTRVHMWAVHAHWPKRGCVNCPAIRFGQNPSFDITIFSLYKYLDRRYYCLITKMISGLMQIPWLVVFSWHSSEKLRSLCMIVKTLQCFSPIDPSASPVSFAPLQILMGFACAATTAQRAFSFQNKSLKTPI